MRCLHLKSLNEKVSHRLIEDLASKQDMSEVATTAPPHKLEPCREVGRVQEASDARRRHEDLQHSRQDVKDARIARMVLAPAMRGDGAANALTNSPTPNCTPPEGTLASHTTITWWQRGSSAAAVTELVGIRWAGFGAGTSRADITDPWRAPPPAAGIH